MIHDDLAAAYSRPADQELGLEDQSLPPGTNGGLERHPPVVRQFLKYAPVPDSDVQRVATALAEAPKKGWRRALDDAYAEVGGTPAYVVDLKRACLVDLLPITADSAVLELGSSLGQHTVTLARRARTVHAIEVVPEQAKFTLERCRQEGCDNVSVACAGDDCTLPYRREVFDIVVINLVLEWCATREENSTPFTAQQRLLAESARVLKPGGLLFLSTKNRFALRRMIGRPDDHAYGIRFGNALPRWLMHLLLRRKGKAHPRGLLHSYGAMRDLLERQGLQLQQSYWAVPDMRYPTRYISTATDAIRKARREISDLEQGEWRSTKLIMSWIPASLVKYVAPGLTFLATKRVSP
jgi:SAM-dependent methyltransferase